MPNGVKRWHHILSHGQDKVSSPPLGIRGMILLDTGTAMRPTILCTTAATFDALPASLVIVNGSILEVRRGKPMISNTCETHVLDVL
jgi:hypothetical protein